MKNICLIIAYVSILGGCVAAPDLNYHLMSDSNRKDNWIPYQLTDTTLVIGVSGQTVSQGTPTKVGSGSDLTDVQNGGSGVGATALSSQSKSARSPSTTTQPFGFVPMPSSDPKVAESSLTAQGAYSQPLSRSELYPVKLDSRDVHCIEDKCDGLVASTAVPIAFESATFAIEPTDHNFVRTFAAPTYVPNSLRLAKLEFSIRDQRQEVIDTVFAAASGIQKLETSGARALAVLRPQPVTLHLPIVIDLQDAKATSSGKLSPLPLNEGTWWYRIEFLDDPAAAGFPGRKDFRNYHAAALTSLCRRIHLILTSLDPARGVSPDGRLADGETKLVMGVSVADPDFLLSIPLPPQGSVTFGTLCGADVSPTASTYVTTNALVADFFSDVNSLRSGATAKSAGAK